MLTVTAPSPPFPSLRQGWDRRAGCSFQVPENVVLIAYLETWCLTPGQKRATDMTAGLGAAECTQPHAAPILVSLSGPRLGAQGSAEQRTTRHTSLSLLTYPLSCAVATAKAAAREGLGSSEGTSPLSSAGTWPRGGGFRSSPYLCFFLFSPLNSKCSIQFYSKTICWSTHKKLSPFLHQYYVHFIGGVNNFIKHNDLQTPEP